MPLDKEKVKARMKLWREQNKQYMKMNLLNGLFFSKHNLEVDHSVILFSITLELLLVLHIIID